MDEQFADRLREQPGRHRPRRHAADHRHRPARRRPEGLQTGFRTGFSCGTVSEVDTDIDVAGSRVVSGAFTVGLCALPGDSGGVVFSGDRALGISSASNVADTGTCANAQTVAQAAGFTPRLSAVPIDDVLAAHPGLTLRTS